MQFDSQYYPGIIADILGAHARYYAQAWSFVHYLFSRKAGLIDLLLQGGSLEQVDELERGWKEHVGRMK